MAREEALKTISLPANADLSASQYCFVVVNSSGKVAVATDNSRPIGVLQDKPAAADRAASVAISGVTKVLAGGTFSKGDRISTDNTGKAVAIGTGDSSLGVALEDGASGKISSIMLQNVGTT